jgi:glycosyltransferase involved in cell wall biosynthesis
MSFEVITDDHHFQATFPRLAYDRDALSQALTQLPRDVRCDQRDTAADLTVLELNGSADRVRLAAGNLFARINGYPEFPEGVLRDFRNAAAPLVSCILLLPFNELFARNVILPSIIQNSAAYPIEIIIVFAGFGVNRAPFEHLRLMDSELTCISKGYNAGVRHARGEYVALFHDDCYVDDPEWISKAIAALRDDVIAVTPEFDQWQQVPVGKAVPLIMRRRDFLQVGGYDEYYYAGVEDMDLTTTITASGMRQAQVDIRYRHLRGMGTSLIVHERPHQLKLLFGYQVLPANVIAQVHRDMMQRLLTNGFIRMLEGDYHLHYLDKHGPLLAECFGVDVARTRYFYEMMRYPYILTPEMAYISNREKLVNAYRALMNIGELERPVED